MPYMPYMPYKFISSREKCCCCYRLQNNKRNIGAIWAKNLDRCGKCTNKALTINNSVNQSTASHQSKKMRNSHLVKQNFFYFDLNYFF